MLFIRSDWDCMCKDYRINGYGTQVALIKIDQFISKRCLMAIARGTTMSFPKQLNLGSGKNFKDTFLNLDNNDYWNPDIVHDLNKPVLNGQSQRFKTKRFGEVVIEKNIFEKIVACDVLEHITNLAVCMKSCLDTLREEGILEIVVPYDLSHGAWQDPTHVRAFNEKSWLYYTEWFWYMGWTEYRFATDKLHLKLSPFGLQLQSVGKEMEEIARTPRAVDAMFIQLKKVPLSEKDYQMLQHYRIKPND